MPVIRPEDFDGFQKKVLAKMQNDIHDAVLRAAHLSRTWLVTERIPSFRYPPIHTGRYKAGWFVEDLKTRIILGNEVLYSVFIEKGIRPNRMAPGGFDKQGRPKPYPALVRWAYLKIARGPKQQRESQAWAIATRVARKHWEKGRKGLKVMTAPISQDTFRRITENELRRAVGK